VKYPTYNGVCAMRKMCKNINKDVCRPLSYNKVECKEGEMNRPNYDETLMLKIVTVLLKILFCKTFIYTLYGFIILMIGTFIWKHLKIIF